MTKLTLENFAEREGIYIEILGRDMTGDALVVPAGVTRLGDRPAIARSASQSALAGRAMYDMLSVRLAG